MQKKWKRFWALLLCLSMISAMVFAVHAEETEGESAEPIEVVEELPSNEPQTEQETEEQAEEVEEITSEIETVEEEQSVEEKESESETEEQPEEAEESIPETAEPEEQPVEIEEQEDSIPETALLSLEEEQNECEHEFSFYMVNNNMEHIGVCLYCGFTTEPQKHSCVFDKGQIEEWFGPIGQTIFETSHIAFCWECSDLVYLPHTPDENGVCTGCGYAMTEQPDGECVHVWRVIALGDGHILRCLLCNLDIEEDCTWVYPEGSPGWGADMWREEGGHKIICPVCGKDSNEAHTYDANMVCTICGYEEHEHTYLYTPDKSVSAFGESWADDGIVGRGKTHSGYCTICRDKFADAYIYGSHHWKNGVCEQCGYVQHVHNDQYDPNPAVGYHLYNGHVNTCSVCKESVYSPHVWEDGVCSVCGYEKNHKCDYSEFRSISAWYHGYRCAECGSYANIIERMDGNGVCFCGFVDPLFHKHIPTEIPGYDTTCTETGLTTVYSCTCGKLFKDEACTVETEAAEVIGAKGHTWQSATCTAPKTCSVCSAVEGTLAAHTPGQWEHNETNHWRFCTACSAKLDDGAHTCDAQGKCSACGYSVHTHSGTKVPGYDATCTETGLTTVYSCTCGKLFKDEACTVETKAAEEITAKGHTWQSATCTAPKTCSVCSAVEGTLAAHTPGQWEHNDTNHWRFCTACSAKLDEGTHTGDKECTACGFKLTDEEHIHAYKWDGKSKAEDGHTMTCSCGDSREEAHTRNAQGKCSVCGYSAHTHSGTKVPGYDATCSETGLTTVYSCTCGRLFKDNACTVQTNAAEVIPAKEHTWKSATCTAPKTCSVCSTTEGAPAEHTPGQWEGNDESHWRFCTECNAKLDENTHVNDGDDICGICGYETPEEEHVHAYTWDGESKDEDGHAMTCSCGDSHKDAHTRNALGRCSICGYSITTLAKLAETVQTFVTTVVNRIISILFKSRG